MRALEYFKTALNSIFSGSAAVSEDDKTAAIPPAYSLDTLINTSTQHNISAPIQSIAMIGAFHDGEGSMYEDDVKLLQNIVSYLERSGVRVAPDARVLPMTLRQDEDIMIVQPQVDMAVLCYVYDDKADKFSDRSNISFLAQSSEIKGASVEERYELWREALENTGANIIFSLGHPEEISVKKVAPDSFIMVIDPQSKTDELPPMVTKMKHKQKSYGLSVHKDAISSLSQEASLDTSFGRMLNDSKIRHEIHVM
ncbi:MAG: hypothetical protein COA45_05335 [Zetaproteobacteria bacterium]|nr:MAG: hypothetical protein COA45_05335 [Zetaproteobacteria bacterium]